jgi:aryl-alcohol dehydrogenase-like predicted oxidoreductase
MIKNWRNEMDRRHFIKTTVGAGLAAVTLPADVSASGLPMRTLGETGARVSVLAFGGGSHFLGRVGGDEAIVEKLIHRALELGINYFDTAASYTFRPKERLSETYYGRILRPHRKKIFLASKSGERSGDAVRRSVEQSLKLLQTDHLDLIQMHSLQEPEELDLIERRDGAWPALQRLKEEGMVRFIGATGHYSPDVLYQAVMRFDLDTLLVSLNAAQTTHPLSMTPGQPLADFEKKVLPAAVERGIAVIAMKVMGQRSIVGEGDGKASPQELIRYALTLPVATVNIAHTSLEILEQNVAAAKGHSAMDELEMAELRARLSGSAVGWADFLHNHADGPYERG